jgi:ATP-dependent helicase HrpB
MKQMQAPIPLPVEEVLGEVDAALSTQGSAILIAEPGAGKTTRVPLALLRSPWLKGKIVMLEPRRIAARAAAHHMARLIGEEAGETVGYSVRFESKVSSKTRIEIVTEGVLTRRLQTDPALEGIGLVIFDEFHERSLDADLGLAFALETRDALRPDLRILAMSATLEGEVLQRLFAQAAIVRSKGRQFPVETRYLGRATRQTVSTDVASAVKTALRREKGSILAFLPGEAEIRRAEDQLRALCGHENVRVLPLHGSLSAQEQDRAIAPPLQGERKVVLATTIAETSLTIEGVDIVIDGGFKRVPRFDPGSALTRLETVRVSASAAEQRRGRAGRLGPGVCYRLWPEEETLALAPRDVPEILQADAAPFLLELALWGIADIGEAQLLDRPPAGAVAQARDLLQLLGALDAQGRITDHGRALVRLPLHPRLAHMVIAGDARGQGRLAAEIAALLQERDIFSRRKDADIRPRLVLLRGEEPPSPDVNRHSLRRARLAANQIRRLAKIGGEAGGDAGELVALAYGERIAQARDKRGSFRLASGGGASIEETDGLSLEKFLAVATTDGKASDARIFLAAPLTLASIEDIYGGRIETIEQVYWDKRTQAVIAKEQRRLGALVLDERSIADGSEDRVAAAMIEGVRMLGLASLPWTDEALALKHRVMIMRRLEPDDGWPDMADEALLASLGIWLKPHLAGARRRDHLAKVRLADALATLVPPALLRRLDRELPRRVSVPSGSSIAIDYSDEAQPVLRVKLQEMFGARDMPALATGRLKLRMELLSPAGRPAAITQDLGRFWASGYAQVRSEMRGRYPTHSWPEDPMTAPPMRGRKRP